MTDRQPNDPSTLDFEETAKKSEAANIADESASYVNADDASPEAKADKTEEAAGD